MASDILPPSSKVTWSTPDAPFPSAPEEAPRRAAATSSGAGACGAATFTVTWGNRALGATS